MAQLFCSKDEFDNANIHIEQAKLHAAENPYKLGRATETQTSIWYTQCRPEEARSEVLRALEIYKGLGAAKDAWDCRELFRKIEGAKERQSSGESDSSGGFSSNDATFHPC